MEVKNFSRLDLENNQGNQGNLQDLNDSINTEISAGDEKSVSQKISDQPTFLFKSLPLYSDTQGLHRKFSKSFKQGINYICNGNFFFFILNLLYRLHRNKFKTPIKYSFQQIN